MKKDLFSSIVERFPRSVDNAINLVDELENKFVSGSDLTKKAINFLKRKFKDFNELMKKADENILQIQDDLSNITASNLQFTKEFLDMYHEAKQEIREIRQELRKLAIKTVSMCKRINLFAENWDERIGANIFKKQFSAMRLLLTTTLETLKKAKEKYNKAIDAISNATDQLNGFTNKINNMTDEHTTEYKDWTTKVRNAAYLPAGLGSIGLLVGDIFGCLGICSTVGNAALWGATAATVESKIAQYSVALKHLEAVGVRIKTNIKDFSDDMEDATSVLVDEISIIEHWESSAKTVHDKIDKISIEDIKKVSALQKNFTSDIAILQNAAQDYLDLPIKHEKQEGVSSVEKQETLPDEEQNEEEYPVE